MTRILSMVALFLLALPLAMPAAAQAGGDLNIDNVYCKTPYKVGGVAKDYFDFACRLRLNGNDTSTIQLFNMPGASLRNGAVPPTAPPSSYVAYSDTGFACIINGQPAGRGTCCTTETRVSVRSDGRITLQCQCKLKFPDKSCEIDDVSKVTERSCAAACKPG
jgi:hypothetical protein